MYFKSVSTFLLLASVAMGGSASTALIGAKAHVKNDASCTVTVTQRSQGSGLNQINTITGKCQDLVKILSDSGQIQCDPSSKQKKDNPSPQNPSKGPLIEEADSEEDGGASIVNPSPQQSVVNSGAKLLLPSPVDKGDDIVVEPPAPVAPPSVAQAKQVVPLAPVAPSAPLVKQVPQANKQVVPSASVASPVPPVASGSPAGEYQEMVKKYEEYKKDPNNKLGLPAFIKKIKAEQKANAQAMSAAPSTALAKVVPSSQPVLQPQAPQQPTNPVPNLVAPQAPSGSSPKPNAQPMTVTPPKQQHTSSVVPATNEDNPLFNTFLGMANKVASVGH